MRRDLPLAGSFVLTGILILVLVTFGATWYPLWLAIIALAVLATVPFVHEYTNNGPLDPFEPVFWVAPLFFLTYGAHAALRLLRDDFDFRGNIVAGTSITSVMLEVLVFASIGLIAIYAGYYWRWSASLGSALPSFRPGWSSQRAWVAIVALLAIGIVGFLSLRPAIGTGPRSHLAKGGSKFAFIAVNFLNIASIIAIADVLIRWPADRWHPSLRTVLKAVVATAIVAGNSLLLWQLDGRGRAFGTMIVAVFLFHYLFRRFSFPAGMGLFAIIKAIPSWAIALLTSIIALDFGGFASELASPYLFRASPYTSFNNIVVLLAGVPERLDFQGGTTFLSALFELVPAQPFLETHIVYNQAFLPDWGSRAGVPITLLGELYLNFGLVGVAIGLFVIGVVIRAVYEWLVSDQATATSLVLFSLLTNSFLLMGNFSNDFPKLGLRSIPMLIVLYFIAGGVDTSIVGRVTEAEI
jgi:hypothetical protein